MLAVVARRTAVTTAAARLKPRSLVTSISSAKARTAHSSRSVVVRPSSVGATAAASVRAMSSSSCAPSTLLPCMSASLEAPSTENTVLFVCDVQETFRGKIVQFEPLIAAAKFLCQAANALAIPIIATEQQPFKPTVSELAPLVAAADANRVFGKTMFSMLTSEVLGVLGTMPARRHVVLVGIETHVCILQTSLDLLRRGYQVHLVADAVSSQTTADRDAALERLRAEGIKVSQPGSLVFTSAESVLYEILKDAKHPKFKDCVPHIKEYSLYKKQQHAAKL